MNEMESRHPECQSIVVGKDARASRMRYDLRIIGTSNRHGCACRAAVHLLHETKVPSQTRFL